MERSKSRTDLLQAGRKKLQQFRQKKDTKGGSSRGKSSKKSDKARPHESDADRRSSPSMSMTSSQVTDGNVEIDRDSNVISRESFESQSLSYSLSPDNFDHADSSSVAIANSTGNETELGFESNLALQDQRVREINSDLFSQDQEKGSEDVVAAEAEDVSLRTSDSLGPEDGATNDHVFATVDTLSPPTSVVTAVGELITVEREGDKREESLLLSEDIPNTPLMQTREDQDPDGVDLKKSFQSTDAEEPSIEAEQLGKSVEVFSSTRDVVADNLSAPEQGPGEGIATGGGPMRNLEGETLSGSHHDEMLLQSSQEQISEEAFSGHDRGHQEGCNQQLTSAGSAAVDPTQELSMGSHEVNLTRPLDVSPIFGASPVNLLQLAEIIRGLNEEEYHFLLNLRGAVSDADPLAISSVLTDHDFSEAFQRLKEELFLANLMKNIFNMQLAEQLELQLQSDNQHCQLVDEVCQLQASHNVVNEKNQHLIEELANCRVELQDFSRKSVELQNQFNTRKAEVEALSARVVELQISFEMSQQDSLDLSTELADCRALISALQAEKKGMNENVEVLIAEKNKFVEEQEFHLCESKKLATELADFKSSMEGVTAENSKLIERIFLVTEERNKIIEEVEHLSNEIERLSLDLAHNKDLVARLQTENSNLNGNLELSIDKIKNLEGENQHAVLENQRLSSEIVSLQEQLSIEKGEEMRLEGDLKEATMHLEQLSKENIFLNRKLDDQKATIEEIGKKQNQPLSQPEDIGNRVHFALEQSEGLQIAITEDSLSMYQQPEEGAPWGPTLNLLEDVFDDSLGFVSLMSCLDEMDKILVKLEKGRIEFHSQSASFSRFDEEEVSSAVVSKLIQAFESKRHEDEHEVEERDSKEVQSSSKLFNMLVKEETRNLRKLLSKWQVHVQSAGALFKGVRDGRKIGDAKYSVLKDQFEELKQYCSNLEASNIELTVQWEAAVQLLVEIQETKCHLEELFEALNQEETHLKAKNNELYEKLGCCQSKVGELYTEIWDVKQSSNEMASVICGQLENLQKEVTQRAMLLEQGWNTTIAEIIALVGKLNESVGKTLSSTLSPDTRYISHQLAISVNAATETIFDLQKKLEAMSSEHEIICSSFKEVNLKCDDLLGRNELAVGVLHKMYNDLRKLVLSHSRSMDEDKIDVQSEALPDLLNYNSYQTILNCLADILNEKLEPESITNEMKSELMQKEAELKELKIKCLGLDTVSKLIEDAASALNVEHSEIEINKAPLSCLDSLVSSLVEKAREADIQLHVTKEGYGSKELELDELKKKIHCQETLHFEKENDILVLKESLHQAEEALTAARSELHEKTKELEHSEQRVSSIREKLSIAVARGKGLVVQRDGLKQSLAETSSELERCLEELQLKDAKLHEVETKLKTYAEAGERMEAMESELSYIRNSSNALRESFLLKDSMLQRIEEVLEDLDLPEQFHSGDIIEKIDWLARSVAGNSLPMNDWEQKDSAGGGSYSDAGYVATDSWKDDSQVPPDSGDDSWKDDNQLQPDSGDVQQEEQPPPSFVPLDSLKDDSQVPPDSGDDSWKDDSQLQPDSGDVQQEEQQKQQQPPSFVPLDGDDLSKKFEELYSKFYGLAEQNEMLEQSLMERNSLVQRWEELIDRIDMPSHLRSMEMEDKIEWVGRALAEANHHVDSLQLKIERYDSHCGLLNSDLEMSQRTVSALQIDLRALITQREHLSEKLEALIFEFENLSAQARQAELKNEVLNNEIASLKDILEKKVAIEEQIFTIEDKLRNLRDLISDVLPESDTKNFVSGKANIDSLEELVRKLVEALMIEKEHSEELEALKCECDKLSAQARQAELENEMLQNEIASLKDILEQKVAIEEQIFTIEGKLRNLQDLVSDVLPDSDTKNLVSGNANIDSLEELVKKLIEALMTEREHLSEKLEGLKCECEKLSAQARQAELENEILHNEIASLKDILEQKVAIEEQIFTIDGKLRNLHDMVSNVLPESETINLVSGSANIDSLEELLRKLIENHGNLQSMKPANGVALDGDHQQKDDATHVEARSIDMHDKEEADIYTYKKDLEEALSELQHVKEERDRTLEKQISLYTEVEALSKRIEELQELLNQEEQKSASVREKLNLAVRKGKSLVQQRDSLKQEIEGMSIMMEHLKSEINNRENALAEHAQKLRQMSTYPERLEALESESTYLKNHLAETEHHLQEKEYSLQLILSKLGEIEVHGEGHISDPVKKLECVGKLCSDLHGTVATLEQESRKSKRASELLLAELNEVQERNDAFQEELAKVAAELVDLRKDKDSSEVARLEALSHLEKLSALHEEGKKGHISEIMGLKSTMNQLSKGFVEVQHLLANAFLIDLESLQNVEAGLESSMKGNNAKNMVDSSAAKNCDGILPRSSDNKKSSLSSDSWSDINTIDHSKDNTIVENFHLLQHHLQQILTEISSFKERIAMHSSLVQEQDKNLSKLIVNVEKEMTSQRGSCEAMRRKISEQDGELIALRGNINYLYKACINSVSVIENGKGELGGNKVEFSDLGINLKTPLFDDGTSEESIKTLADRLLMAAKEVTSIRTEDLAANQNEMKATITSMQRELQEKDVQRERMCSQLVKQIKDAEAAANSYCQDLQSLRIQEQNFKKQVEVIEAERKILEQRVNELQDSQGTAAELDEKIRSQNDLLTAKDQEIEALMHALDEEEVQMEELTKKIEELEKVIQQKSQEIENLESSRGKVMKKLAITVSKFDELHHLSASLLSEVEKHQSQLQERDAEISFLRQEVTKCTNDVLLASQISNQSSDEIFEFLMWVDMMVSQDGMHDMNPDMKSNSQVHEYKEIIHKKLMSVLSELENLKAIAESKDEILQVERKKVEELNRKAETLETSLHEKEMQLNLLEGVEETGKVASTNSEILEVEPVTNEWTATGTFVTTQVRSLRKGNNDHVAIAVDEDPGSTSRIEDEEDDKVHGFKSLRSSKIVPRFTRPLTDLIDGVWVSCDRTLMRRPILRLGIIMYWAIMHALLAFFVV